jgi:hypothetical protein
VSTAATPTAAPARDAAASVDIDPVNLEEGRFLAAGSVVGRAALIGGCLSPHAKVVALALDHGRPLVLGYVLVLRVLGGDADLAAVGGLGDDAVVADRVGGGDPLKLALGECPS